MSISVLVSGAGGFLGGALCERLVADGHRVGRLVRRASNDPNDILWNATDGVADPARLADYDAVVHLAGENLAGSRWSESVKRRLRASRIDGTNAIIDAMRNAPKAPSTFVCASAVGYYGDRGDDVLTEESEVGTGFLAELCRDWEATARGAEVLGCRVVMLRSGVILAKGGGALAKMLPAFRAGVAGPLGSGRQFFSWIALEDAVRAIVFALMEERVSGPVNVVAPQPVTNERFTKALGEALGRPTLLRAPAFALRLVLGEMADEALLASQRAVPKKLEAAGFSFAFPEVVGFLEREFAGGG